MHPAALETRWHGEGRLLNEADDREVPDCPFVIRQTASGRISKRAPHTYLCLLYGNAEGDSPTLPAERSHSSLEMIHHCVRAGECRQR